jgi:two-component system alkaline phosphatase synthesis response regulator PhoP
MDKKRIFIADDDNVAVDGLRKLLQLSGFEVTVCLNPKEVVDGIRSFKPDLILLDLLMPHLGGLEICAILNSDKDTQGIPVIVVSALGREADIKNAYHLGVVGYFTKPYDFPKLLQEINKTLAYKET